ncbi:MAG: IS630 family transposase [Thermoplasmata archaeon]
MRVAPPIELSPDEQSQLETWSRGRSTPQRLVLRARIVLRAAKGKENQEIADELVTRPNTVGLWRRRFLLLRLGGIEKDAPRPGRNPRLPRAVVARIVDRTLHSKPRGRTHWSTRVMAKEIGVDPVTVHRVWRRYGLKPHLYQSFKRSRDRRCEEKVVDLVGLYQNPPEKAIVFSVDEKPPTQALERTPAILPMGKNWRDGRPHDSRRNGAVDLFAALNILDGQVVTGYYPQHTQKEFLAFMDVLDRRVPFELQVHVALDNRSVHKGKRVQRWLRRHPRFIFRFVPTSSSWMHMVEGWLGHLQRQALTRGSFHSVPDLVHAIEEYAKISNGEAHPWVWTQSAEEILRKVRKIRQLLGWDPTVGSSSGGTISHPSATPH